MAKRRTSSRRPTRSRASRPRPSAPKAPGTPIAGPQAFANLVDASHVQSQAATLLLIGSHLRGDAAATAARASAARNLMPSPTDGIAEPLPAEDVAALDFPRMQVGPARFSPASLERMAEVRFASRPGPAPAPRDVRAASTRLVRVSNAFYRDANPGTAAALLEVSLRHPLELVRVAAAASYVEVAVDPKPAILILEHGVRSRDRLTRDVAAHALARFDPRNTALERLLVAQRRPSRRRRSRTSTIVHGTWARTSAWWQPPTGDFWKFLHDNVDLQLYGAADRFEWSGGYSDAARALASIDLRDWVLQHNLDGLDLFTHSHGGSVAMLANQAGVRVGRLVLLSCPVHWPKYAPDFTRVTKAVSVRVHLDLVILVDGGGQRFPDNRIAEHVLPIWFDHFATHDPDTWVQHHIADML